MDALFPGSFDPLTLGHYDIIKRAQELFEKVYIAIGINIAKPRYFEVGICLKMIEEVFKDDPGVNAITYEGLTAELCKNLNVKYIIRGIRNVGDFEYERSMAEMNRHLLPDIETIFFNTRPEFAYISSSNIRDLLSAGSDVSDFVPKEILQFITK